jgi:hypothetical protein
MKYDKLLHKELLLPGHQRFYFLVWAVCVPILCVMQGHALVYLFTILTLDDL